MDPLSIIASVIAVAGAVTATSKLLATVIRLRHVPSQFVQLYDEVRSFRLFILSWPALGSRGAVSNTQSLDLGY